MMNYSIMVRNGAGFVQDLSVLFMFYFFATTINISSVINGYLNKLEKKKEKGKIKEYFVFLLKLENHIGLNMELHGQFSY
jgi:hypothetical protein